MRSHRGFYLFPAIACSSEAKLGLEERQDVSSLMATGRNSTHRQLASRPSNGLYASSWETTST